MHIELGEADAGTQHGLKVGDQITVRLPERPTTGYQWEAQFDDLRLRVVDDRFEGPETPRGAGGTRVLVFEATQVGPVKLALSKRRSWGDTQPIETLEFEVHVGEST